MAKEELYIEAKLDAEQLYQDLKELKSQIEKKKMDVTVNAKMTKSAQQVTAWVNQIADASKKAAKATEENARAQWKLNKAVEEWQEAFNAYSPEIQEQINKVLQLEKTYKTLAAAMKDPVTNTQQVRQAFIATKSALADARKELSKMQEPIKWATWWFGRLFSSLRNVASSQLRVWILSTFWAFSLAWATAKAIKGLVNTIKESVDAFISFESAFAWVRKTVEATDYQFDAFSRTLKDMTTYIPMAYEDLAKIAELGWQMGVPIENLQKFTETLAAISVSTNLWLEDAALSLSRIASVMWIDYSDVDKLGSAIVDLWNNFAATESEITTFVEKIAWVWNVVWLTAWDVTWISAAITSVWIAAEKWWTAVNKLLIAMNDAATQWWDELKTLAEITNMTAEEFQQLWKADAWEAFVRVIEWMWAAWDDAVKYIEDLVWTGTRVKEVFLNMASASDKLREAVTRGNEAYRENRALMEEAAKRYGTTESQIQMLNNQITLNKELLWEALVPLYIELKHALVDLSSWLIKVVEKFNQMSEWDQLKTIVAAIWALSAALMLINPVVWVLFWLVSGATVWFAKWYDATEDEAYALWELHSAMEETNDALYENERKIDELNEEFEKGTMSVNDYKEALESLMKQQRELKKEQQELSEQIVAFGEVAERVDDMKANFEDRVQELSALDDQLVATQREIEKTETAINNLEAEWQSWWISTEEYRERVWALLDEYDKLQQKTADLGKSHAEAESWLMRYWEAYKKVAPWLQALNEFTDNQVELENILNDITINTDASQEQVSALKNRFDELRQSAILAIDAMITAKQLEIDEKVNFKEGGGLTWWSKLTHGNRYDKQVTQLDKLRDQLANLKEMTFENVFEWVSLDKTEVTEKLLGIDVNDWSVEQLRENIASVQKQKEKYNEKSEEYIALWKKEAEMQERLKNIVQEETEALEDNAEAAAKSWASQKDLIKIQEERLELEAKKRVLALQDAALSEKDYANAVLKINEDLEKAKDDLRKDWYDKEVESMEKIVEKYKELEEEAKKAMSWLADDIKSNSNDIAKLIKKIQDLRRELEELEAKRVSDLWERYVELQWDLEELNKKISELEWKTSERWDSWKTVSEIWEEIADNIDEAEDNVKDYGEEIDKLTKKIADLEKDTAENLSDRYAEVVEEVQKLNEELEKYTKYDILTDADAKAKADLEQQIASLLSEKNKIEQNLTDAQLQRAESMVGETETDKILRQAAEQKDAYQSEIDEYKSKLNEQQSLLESYRAQQLEMAEKYNWLEIDNEQAKYDKLIQQLEDYTKKRDAIIAEMDMISQNLTAQQIQDAIINSKKTETELILENYRAQKQALEAELDDYEDQLNKKLELLAKYYWDAALLQQKYGDVWIRFSDEDLKKIKEAAENMKWIKDTTAYSNYGWNIFKTQQDALDEQKKAQKNLENISKTLDKLTDYQLKSVWTETLKELYNKILQLQLTASGKGVGTGNVTTTSNISQSFNVNNVNDAAVIASAIRRQIKL